MKIATQLYENKGNESFIYCILIDARRLIICFMWENLRNDCYSEEN